MPDWNDAAECDRHCSFSQNLETKILANSILVQPWFPGIATSRNQGILTN